MFILNIIFLTIPYRLYASPNHVSRGEIIVLAGLNTLWHSILVLVNTTVPMAKQGQTSIQQYEDGPSKMPPTESVEFDSIGPVCSYKALSVF